MAKVFIKNIISNDLISDMFPTIGSKSTSNRPMWMSSMRIFKIHEYQSEAGHRYLKGIRFSNNMAVAFTFSFWNTWTYLNEIEVYRFNGNHPELVDRRNYEKQFYHEDFLMSEVESMVLNALQASSKMNGQIDCPNSYESQIKSLVEGTYRPLSEYDLTRLDVCVKTCLPQGKHV